ncbi:MAG: hypothetical protein JWO69_1688 [Thermoleophilia bacterium]|nr:hypothetical protein [Thermoleophilia bacterium]
MTTISPAAGLANITLELQASRSVLDTASRFLDASVRDGKATRAVEALEMVGQVDGGLGAIQRLAGGEGLGDAYVELDHAHMNLWNAAASAGKVAIAIAGGHTGGATDSATRFNSELAGAQARIGAALTVLGAPAT